MDRRRDDRKAAQGDRRLFLADARQNGTKIERIKRCARRSLDPCARWRRARRRIGRQRHDRLHPAANQTPEEARRQASQRQDRSEFAKVEAAINAKLAADRSLSDLRRQVRYTQTREGLRIEIIDRAGFSMFSLGTDRLVPRAAKLMASVAGGIAAAPNPIAVRGHTDALRYTNAAMNNWKLSSQRAEATRAAFEASGIGEARFARIEGVSDREPYFTANPADPRNRRITVTLFYRDPGIAG